MITKYNEYIKENASTNQFFKTYKETKKWLDKMRIKNYTINQDLTIDVNGGVDLSYRNLTFLPVKFNKITGFFYCSYNDLTTIIGSPEEVDGFYECSCNKITSLKGCPQKVGEYFSCSYNKLANLLYLPIISGNELFFYNNPLTSLEGLSIYNLINNIDIDSYDYKELNPKIKEDWFNIHLEKNPEIFSLINFETTKKFKEKWYYLFNANKFDLI